MAGERIATWWIRWEDLNWPDSDNYDSIKARAEAFAKANVSAAMLFGTHFRFDWLPFFPLLHDYIATVAEKLHKYGIKLYDHHSVSLVHRYSTREEMRHVMLDSGPHLPFSPTFEAAKSWQYKGKYLNDWRMIDAITREPLYFPQYTAEGFCCRNPEFKEAYFDYVKTLIADTGIDGLSADDAVHFLHYKSCACPHCRAELKRRAGIDLPPYDDMTFWGNFDNPAWLHWLDIRFDSNGEFYEGLRAVVPEGFMLTGCGGSSATPDALLSATDQRTFLRGTNYVNMEMSGNTPPYKHDPMTVNVLVKDRLTNSSHHQAAAREKGVRAFCTGFAHSAVSANHVWAVSKILGADAWIGTLKGRLGLPRHILDELPNEVDIVGEAFGFEKEHPELFDGDSVGQLGVYFSYETRNHTFFGNLDKGYFRDYRYTLVSLFREGICPHTVFDFPKDTKDYPIILLSSAVKMTADELAAMDGYIKNGGKVVVTGPTAIPGCENSWKLPNKPCVEPCDFHMYAPKGLAWPKPAGWTRQTEIEPSADHDVWTESRCGLLYNPRRISEGTNIDYIIELCRKHMKRLPVSTVSALGYLSAVSENSDSIIVQFLAEDYDVDIDHALDGIRTHRSRVNIVNKVEPIGIDGVLKLESKTLPEVYTPFCESHSEVIAENGIVTVRLPEKCSYAILKFAKL